MKFFEKSDIDKEGRVNLHGLLCGVEKVVAYQLKPGSDLIYVEAYSDASAIPQICACSLDNKSRFIMPKWLRDGVSGYYIGIDDDGRPLLKAFRE